MKISHYIKSLKVEKVKTDLLRILFLFIISFVVIIVSLLLLEAIFYFTPKVKKLTILSVSGLVFLKIIFVIAFLLLVDKEYFDKYSGWSLARIIGKSIFPNNKDTALNALQIENAKNKNQSSELADNFTQSIAKKIERHNPKELVDKKPIINVKMATSIIMLLSIIFLSVFSKQSSNAFYRWKHYNQKFHAPKPFKLYNLTKNHHILGGEESSITIMSEGANPDTVNLILSPTQESTSKRDSMKIVLKSGRDMNGFYQFKLPALFQDYEYNAFVNANHFYEAWKIVVSTPDTIFVTDRPKLEEFEMVIIPPSYSRLPSEKLDGSIAAVQGLKGSEVKINLMSNRKLKSSFIKQNDSIQYLNTMGYKGSGSFKIKADGEFSIHLVDPRGITNRDPIPYKINVITDHYPMIKITDPALIVSIAFRIRFIPKLKLLANTHFERMDCTLRFKSSGHSKPVLPHTAGTVDANTSLIIASTASPGTKTMIASACFSFSTVGGLFSSKVSNTLLPRRSTTLLPVFPVPITDIFIIL